MDQTRLEEARTLIKEVIKENFPNVDVRKGTVISELLIPLASIGYATIYEDLKSFEDKMYLQQILTDPNSFDTSTVDAIMSNFFVDRKTGSKAKGIIQIIVPNNERRIVPSGTAFYTVDNLEFVTTQAYDTDDVGLYHDDVSSTYYFLINVEAASEGTQYLITTGTALTTEYLPGVTILVTAWNDFYGGINAETNDEYITRARNTLGLRDLQSKQSISAELNSAFPEIRQISVIGYNDREMQRNKNNIGMKVGGKVDMYIRTIGTPLTKTITMTTDANGEVLIVDPDLIPMLRVQDIALTTDPLHKYMNFTLLVDHTNLDRTVDPYSYRFSSYEALTLVTDFIEKEIFVTADYLPLIKEVQNYILGEEKRNLCSDQLVRSFMPCYISMEIEYKSSEYTTTLEDTIRNGIIDYINNLDESVLYVSKIIDVIHNVASLASVKLPLNLTGNFYLPDGSIETKISEDRIEIEEDVSLSLSGKTYRYFVMSSDITFLRI